MQNIAEAGAFPISDADLAGLRAMLAGQRLEWDESNPLNFINKETSPPGGDTPGIARARQEVARIDGHIAELRARLSQLEAVYEDREYELVMEDFDNIHFEEKPHDMEAVKRMASMEREIARLESLRGQVKEMTVGTAFAPVALVPRIKSLNGFRVATEWSG